jgi:hypothetical protein
MRTNRTYKTYKKTYKRELIGSGEVCSEDRPLF